MKPALSVAGADTIQDRGRKYRRNRCGGVGGFRLGLGGRVLRLFGGVVKQEIELSHEALLREKGEYGAQGRIHENANAERTITEMTLFEFAFTQVSSGGESLCTQVQKKPPEIRGLPSTLH